MPQGLFLAWLVAKPTAYQDDNQQCRHPQPMRAYRSVLVTIGAGKSDAKPCEVSTLACSKIAMNRLPAVWLKTHVKMMAMAMTNRTNIGKFVRKVAKLVTGPPCCPGVRKCGRCQQAHKTLRMIVLYSEP